MVMLGGLKKSICQGINRRLDIAEDLEDNSTISTQDITFQGYYNNDQILGNSNPDEFGQSIGGCFKNDASDQNIFYYVLIAR